MSAAELTEYVSWLRQRLGFVGAASADLTALNGAAANLAALLDTDPAHFDAAQWQVAVQDWEQKRSVVLRHLGRAVLGELAGIPGFRQFLGDPEALARNGLRAELDLGPVRVAASSGVFYIQPPTLPDGTQLPPVPIGPFELGALDATMASPFAGGGSGLPGGGLLVRIAGEGGLEKGWGGRLQVPLPPVLIDAAAILSTEGVDPSFLAVLGIEFVPPIQLSFGFSLDRVGGIVGINRAVGVDALRAAIRDGSAGDALFRTAPPADVAAIAVTLDHLFPRRIGAHLVGPSLKISWLSFGASGSLVSLDLAIVLALPVGKVALLGVARMGIPQLPQILNFRLDMLGIVDPVEHLVTVDASLVDSHVLGIFQVYGDAALRLCWGSQPYTVVSVGGFFPGFDPKPAKLPPLRRVGMSQSVPGAGITLRVEGYFAVTANSIQLGGRIEAGISLIIQAHGFIETDALVQFRPFRFQAKVAAGFCVHVEDFSFGSVQLTGAICGPGPITVRGSLSISVFLFEISWDQTFTLGSGPADALPIARPLLDVLAQELARHESLRAANTADAEVVLVPRPPAAGFALVPPTGTLQIQQRLAPLGLPLERLQGVPLAGAQGVRIDVPGTDVLEGFAPGSFFNLSDAQQLNRPPFEDLPAGKVLTPADPTLTSFAWDKEVNAVCQIVIDTRSSDPLQLHTSSWVPDLTLVGELVRAARAEPALSAGKPVLAAEREQWVAVGSGKVYASASAAHEFARLDGSVAVARADLEHPVDLAGV